MKEFLNDSDCMTLSKDVLDSFEKRMSAIPHDLCSSFYEEARQLEAELVMVYRIVVLCTKNEELLERVSQWWSTMVCVCDEFAKKLGHLVAEHPSCGADQYYDRVLELRSKCLRLQKMHG